ATLGGTIVAGRDFDVRDLPTSPNVAIVTESMARRFFGAASPIGRVFRVQNGTSYGPPIQIVGLVKDMKYQSLREKDTPIAFVAQSQNAAPGRAMSFEVRVSGDPSGAVPTIRS